MLFSAKRPALRRGAPLSAPRRRLQRVLGAHCFRARLVGCSGWSASRRRADRQRRNDSALSPDRSPSSNASLEMSSSSSGRWDGYATPVGEVDDERSLRDADVASGCCRQSQRTHATPSAIRLMIPHQGDNSVPLVAVHVDLRRLRAIAREEKRPVGTVPQDRWTHTDDLAIVDPAGLLGCRSVTPATEPRPPTLDIPSTTMPSSSPRSQPCIQSSSSRRRWP
jgi:hypothetical protein